MTGLQQNNSFLSQQPGNVFSSNNTGGLGSIFLFQNQQQMPQTIPQNQFHQSHQGLFNNQFQPNQSLPYQQEFLNQQQSVLQQSAQSMNQQRSTSVPPQPNMRPHPFNRLLDNLVFECGKYLSDENNKSKKKEIVPIPKDEQVKKALLEEIEKFANSERKKRSTSLEPISIQVAIVPKKLNKVKVKTIPFTRSYRAEEERIIKESIQNNSVKITTTAVLSARNNPSPPPPKIKHPSTSDHAGLTSPIAQRIPIAVVPFSSSQFQTPATVKHSSHLSTAIHSNPPEVLGFSLNKNLQTPEHPKINQEKKKIFLSAETKRDTSRKMKPSSHSRSKSKKRNETEIQEMSISKNLMNQFKQVNSKPCKIEATLNIVLREDQKTAEEKLILSKKTASNVFSIVIEIEKAKQLEDISIREFSKILVDHAVKEYRDKLEQLRKSRVYVETLGKDSFLVRVDSILSFAQSNLSDSVNNPEDFDFDESEEQKIIRFLRGEVVLPIKDDVSTKVSDWFEFSCNVNRITCVIVETPWQAARERSTSKKPRSSKKISAREDCKTDLGRFIFAEEQEIEDPGYFVTSIPDLGDLMKRQGKLAKVKGLCFFNKYGKITFLKEIRLSKITNLEKIVKISHLEIDFDDKFLEELRDSNFNERRSLEVELIHYQVPQKIWFKISQFIEQQWQTSCVFSSKDNNSVTFRVDLAHSHN